MFELTNDILPETRSGLLLAASAHIEDNGKFIAISNKLKVSNTKSDLGFTYVTIVRIDGTISVCVDITNKTWKLSNCLSPKYLLVLTASTSLDMRIIRTSKTEVANRIDGMLVNFAFNGVFT
jgi:hypothetical protein